MVIPTDIGPGARQVLALILEGRTDKEIASRINLTVGGVKYHVSRILHAFGASNRMELIAKIGHFEIVWVPNKPTKEHHK